MAIAAEVANIPPRLFGGKQQGPDKFKLKFTRGEEVKTKTLRQKAVHTKMVKAQWKLAVGLIQPGGKPPVRKPRRKKTP